MRAWGPAALGLLLVAPARALAPPPVVVAGQPIAFATIDARCGEPCAHLIGDVRARKAAGLAALVDEALLAEGPSPAPAPVPEAAVDAYLAAHAADFDGPPLRDRAAVRFFLEREALRAATAERVAQARAGVPVTVTEGPALADPTPADRVLATVGTRVVRNRDVEARLAWPLYRLRGELALERRRHADALVEEALWAREAAAHDTTVEALRAGLRDGAAVSDADVAAAVAEEARRRAGTPASAERMRPYLAFRAARAAEEAFLADAARRAGLSVHIPMPRPPRLALGPGALGWRGDPTAAARIVFLTSHRGEATRRLWDVVRRLAAEPGTAVAVRPLLPQWDPEGTAVAVAVHCAAAAGRGWELWDAVATHTRPPGGEDLAALAAGLGVDLTALDACAADPATAAAVAAESAEAERLGLDDPPAVLVDGRPFTGVQRLNRLRAVARAARRRDARPVAP